MQPRTTEPRHPLFSCLPVLGIVAGVALALLLIVALLGDPAAALTAGIGLACFAGSIVVVALLTAAVAGLVRAAWVARTNRMRDVMVVDFEPPQDLTPVEAGYMWDGRITDRDVFADLLHMSAQGRVTMTRDGQTIWVRLGDEAADGASASVADGGPGTSVADGVAGRLVPGVDTRLDDLVSGRSGAAIRTRLSNLATRSLFAKGLLVRRRWVFIFFAVLLVALTITSAISLKVVGAITRGSTGQGPASAAGAISQLQAEYGSLWGAFWDVYPTLTALMLLPYIALMAAAFVLFQRINGIRGGRSAAFARRWKELQGFREYLERAELDRTRFFLSEGRVNTAEGESRAEQEKLAWMLALGLDVDWRAAIAQGRTNA